MAKPLVSDELWAVVAPLLPPHRPRDPRKPGRRRVPDRACLTGIGDGVRQRDDLLAPAAGLAAGRGVARAAPGAPAPPGRGWADRLEPGERRRGAGPGKGGGEQTGKNPVDRGQPGSHPRGVVVAGGVVEDLPARARARSSLLVKLFGAGAREAAESGLGGAEKSRDQHQTDDGQQQAGTVGPHLGAAASDAGPASGPGSGSAPAS